MEAVRNNSIMQKHIKEFTGISTEKIILLLLLVFIYKFLLEVSYWSVLAVENPVWYVFKFNTLKYLNGIFWCVVIFFLIDYTYKRASSFFLFLIYVMQIIPITVVYAVYPLSSPLYYNLLLISYVLCEILVRYIKPYNLFIQYDFISKLMIPFFVVASFVVIVVLIMKKGIPSLELLDIYKVYIYRRNNPLNLGLLLGQMYLCTVKVFLPVLFVKFAIEKQYLFSGVAALSILIIYLLTGHKTFLFSIPLCIIGIIFSSYPDCFTRFYSSMLSVFSFLCVSACIWPSFRFNILRHVYDLVIRRVLFTPAILKFCHYDYFCTHPLIGLYGVIPKYFNPYVPRYYAEVVDFPFDIARIYFNAPAMSSDTGFLVEGFSRFGYIGFVVTVIILSAVLFQIDAFQYRTSYKAAVAFFLYPIYSLTEVQIIGNLDLGIWMFLLIFIFYYSGVRREL